MVSNRLLADVMSKAGDCVYIFLGDVNQLTAIDWGSTFRAILDSRSVPAIELTHIHRCIDGSSNDGIIANCTNMISAPYGVPYSFLDAPNFKLHDCSAHELADLIIKLRNTGVRSDQFAILCPYSNGHGVDELSKLCQVTWCGGNPSTTDSKGRTWIVGDKIVFNRNNYDIDIYNGEEGTIAAVDATSVTACFQTYSTEVLTSTKLCRIESCGNNTYNRYVQLPLTITFDGLDVGCIDLAYILTAHKAQGSEWLYVIYFMPRSANSNGNFLNRALSYVCISRGKKLAIMAGNTFKISESIGKMPSYRCDMMTNILKSRLPRLYERSIRSYILPEVKYFFDDYIDEE